MRNAIINSSNIIGFSASNSSARAIVAARDAHTSSMHTGKRLPEVGVPVVRGYRKPSAVSVRGALCERPETRCTTGEQLPAMWQTANFELPAAAWATIVLNRTTSV